MTESLPYMTSTGLIAKILDQAKKAATPDKFGHDFLSTVLGYGSGSARPFVPFAKRLGLIGNDGSPTDLYKRFRGGEPGAGIAIAEAMRRGYAPLFKRNEYAHKLDAAKLKDLVIEVSGSPADSSTVKAIVGSFSALRRYADFESPPSVHIVEPPNGTSSDSHGDESDTQHGNGVGLRFGYTINVNLPATSDIAVFNAIFKSMKENLL